MICRCFLKLARYNFLVPTNVHIDTLNKFIEDTIPPITTEEFNYFQESKLVEAYEEDKNYQTTLVEPGKGEPGLLFHEFIYLLGMIAYHCCRNTASDIGGQLENFFVEKLNFQKVADSSKIHMSYQQFQLDQQNKAHKKSYEELPSDDEGNWESEDDLDEQTKAFQEFLQMKQQQEAEFIIDYDAVLDSLDKILPQIPAKPVVEQINPRPYLMPI